ncbi:DUF5691 domain-containing protein [Occallatibacter savannae]|uniref:DUF5691 domain-containing protein n=1 Tax=Occallatibacter savannae TaxID=1002691 RepID=UPI000D68CC19|nr:DUF5691 domain-containing protein [Occallatibacter savannae]
MNAEELKVQLLPILLSGARRGSGEELLILGNDREHSILAALSLTGQSLRFTRPAVPSEFAVEHWPRDERRIVPDGLRRPILRLLDRSTDDTARALALAFEKQKLRPHPFDLPLLDGFGRRYADRLGATAQFWVQRETPAQQTRGYFEADELTADNWTESALRQRVKFLRELRNQDPAAARSLLERSWSGENPDSRVQLLSILLTGLSAEDKQFLESIQKDRAPRVRAIVHRMLGTLSGTTGENAALAACSERIQQSKTGLLKKRLTLKLELPANVKEHEANRWIQEQFADVNLEQLAHAYRVSDRELVDAAEKDDNLLFALALLSSRERRFDLLDAITDRLPDAWGRMGELSDDDLEQDGKEAFKWICALLKPKKWVPASPFPSWSWLHRQMEGYLPGGIMRDVLQSKVWKEQLEPEKKGGSEFVQVICALCPPELRGLVRTQLDPLEVDRKDKGWMLLDILDELENVR